LVARVSELGLNAGPFELDGVTALMDLGAGEHTIGGEVDEAFFAGFQLRELPGQGVVEFAGEPLLVGHGGVVSSSVRTAVAKSSGTWSRV
jgi:hypothetical protein